MNGEGGNRDPKGKQRFVRELGRPSPRGKEALALGWENAVRRENPGVWREFALLAHVPTQRSSLWAIWKGPSIL